jgi:hypothetical protein
VLGIPVVGPTADLDHAIATLDADRVALPDGSAEHVISVVRAACATTGARLVGGGLE